MPGSAPDRALTEKHWSYMDRFAAGIVARGPTLAPDRETWTGSLHILDLPTVEAAEQFVEQEPYNRAGLFAEHLVRRFVNLLGRTMWESPPEGDDPLFLAIAHAASLAVSPERAIVHGQLLSLHDAEPAGAVLAFQAASRPDWSSAVEIHDWELGGRR